MDLKQLRYLEAVVRNASFTRAALELYVVQPTLSQQIKRLERELGVQLLDRTGGRVTATSAGAALLRRATKVLHEIDEAHWEMQNFATASAGHVAFGALFTLNGYVIDIPELLARFGQANPDVSVHYKEADTVDLAGQLRNGTIDFAILDVEMLAYFADLDIELIIDDQLVALVGPMHSLAHRKTCQLIDLAKEPLVRLNVGAKTNSPRRALERAAGAVGFTPHFMFEVGSVSVCQRLVAAGVAAHVTHPWLGRGGESPVAVLALEDVRLPTRIAIAQMKNRTSNAAASSLLSLAKAAFRVDG